MSQMYPYVRPPFHKRRPVLFFFLLVIVLLAVIKAAMAVWNIFDARGVFSGPRIGVVTVEGFIGDADRTAAWVETLRKNKSVAGVLLRVNSSGGAVAPSQELFSAVKRLASEKPVVVSMGAVAASGGYYIAVAGKELFASPSTLTGSIGVRLQLADARELMDRIGVRSESLTTGKFKATGSPFQGLSEEERAYLQALLDDMRDEFINAVAQNRSLPKETVAVLADGRVFTGRQALAHKLVDHLGDREAALDRLAALCGITGTPELLCQPERSKPLWRTLLEMVLQFEAEQTADTARYMFRY